MRICIVEDESTHVQHLCSLLHKWEHENRTALEIDSFSSEEKLLVKKEINYDIIFLDIRLGDKDGLQVARSLRERNYTNALVFLTAYREYVFEGYNVHALNYILKPISYEELTSCLEYVQQTLRNASFVYQYRSTILQIPYQTILYFSSCNQYSEVVTQHGSYKQFRSLKSILPKLPTQFIRCHRTAIVNMHYIRSITKKEILLSSDITLPVSKTYLESVKQAFIQYTKSGGIV